MKEKKKSIKSDLKRLDAIKDEDIDYSDIPELGDEFFEKALVLPPAKKLIAIRLDADVIDWLKKEGRGYQTRANKLLRAVMEQQQHKQRQRRAGGMK